jgi:hypothetical protein
VLPTGPAAVRTRLKWYTISTRVESAARGVVKVIHPFLVKHSTNWMDIMLVRHLLVEEPFSASFGKSGSAWKEFATALRIQMEIWYMEQSASVTKLQKAVRRPYGVREKGAR